VETYYLEKDIAVLYVLVATFPAGINEAYAYLRSRLQDKEERTYIGILMMNEQQEIVYRAGTLTRSQTEAITTGLDTFVLMSGMYLAETVQQWRDDIRLIGQTFQKLVHANELSGFPCIEWYNSSGDVTCMVKLDHS
jgi:hypothetical protein